MLIKGARAMLAERNKLVYEDFETFQYSPLVSIEAARSIKCFRDAAEVTVKLIDRTKDRRQQATDVQRGDR